MNSSRRKRTSLDLNRTAASSKSRIPKQRCKSEHRRDSGKRDAPADLLKISRDSEENKSIKLDHDPVQEPKFAEEDVQEPKSVEEESDSQAIHEARNPAIEIASNASSNSIIIEEKEAKIIPEQVNLNHQNEEEPASISIYLGITPTRNQDSMIKRFFRSLLSIFYKSSDRFEEQNENIHIKFLTIYSTYPAIHEEYEMYAPRSSKVENELKKRIDKNRIAGKYMIIRNLRKDFTFENITQRLDDHDYNLDFAQLIANNKTFQSQNIEDDDRLVLELKKKGSICSRLNVFKNTYWRPSPQIPSRNGLVGLHNLGNTCFMNSTLQCLYRSQKLKEYILERRQHGSLSRAFRELVMDMENTSSSATSPQNIKKTIEKYTSLFRGHDQHDAHDFFSIFIEYLNKEQQDASDQIDEGDLPMGLSDNQLAQFSWDRFKMNNPGDFVDLLHGQLLYKTICSGCRNQTNSSDNFSSISLPLPSKIPVKYEIDFVPLSTSQEYSTFLYKQEAEKGNLKCKDLKEYAKALFKVDSVFVAELKDNRFEREVKDNKRIRINQQIVVYQTVNSPLHRTVVIEYQNKQGFSRLPKLVFLSKALRKTEMHEEVFKFTSTFLDTEDETADKFYKNLQFNHDLTDSLAEDRELARIVQSGQEKYYPFYYWSLPSKELNDRDLILKIRLKNNYCEKKPVVKRKRVLTDENTEQIENILTLDECFKYLCRKETISKKNSFSCPTCETSHRSEKTVMISRIPGTLVVNLKRKSQNSSRHPSHQQREFIDFPFEDLDLSDYVVGDARHLYDLYGIICYFGSSYSGHYISYAKSSATGDWYCFNDSSVTRIRDMEQEGVNFSANVLFYQKKESII